MRRTFVVLALCLGCQASGGRDAGAMLSRREPPPTADPAAESYVGPALPRAKVVLQDAFGGKHVVDVEVAATEASRERGLMWRKELAAGTGMLFIFPGEQVMSFWMRNTLIPLDMLFISKDGLVNGVVENAEPQTLTSRGVRALSLYVLEVPGGWCAKVGVGGGTHVELQGIGNIPVK